MDGWTVGGFWNCEKSIKTVPLLKVDWNIF